VCAKKLPPKKKKKKKFSKSVTQGTAKNDIGKPENSRGKGGAVRRELCSLGERGTGKEREIKNSIST